MKLSGRDIARFSKAPDPGCLGCLLYGPDPALTAVARRDLVSGISEGDDLRISRLDGPDIRRDPAALDEALRARGFFPGRRVVHVSTGRDEIAKVVEAALDGLTPEDAFLVIEAGALKKTSALRKLFEGRKELAAGALYPDPPDAHDLKEMLLSAGCRHGVSDDAVNALLALAQDVEPAEIQQLVDKIGVYSLSDDGPLNADAVWLAAPQTVNAELDALIDAVASGRTREVAPLLARFASGGGSPVQTVIMTGRRFRQILQIAAEPNGIDAGLAKIKPPLFGPRRNAMKSQSMLWPRPRVEAAVRLLQETDRTLRSPGSRPDRAVIERCLIRLSMMAVR